MDDMDSYDFDKVQGGLVNLESEFLRDFSCCGTKFPEIHGLERHLQEFHHQWTFRRHSEIDEQDFEENFPSKGTADGLGEQENKDPSQEEVGAELPETCSSFEVEMSWTLSDSRENNIFEEENEDNIGNDQRASTYQSTTAHSPTQTPAAVATSAPIH